MMRGKTQIAGRWTYEEDRALCRAWLCVPMTDDESCWETAHSIYSSNNDPGLRYRTVQNMKNRFSKILQPLIELTSILDELREENNGDAEDILVKRSIKLYYYKHKTKCPVIHIWSLLKDEPKWIRLCLLKKSQAETVSEDNNVFVKEEEDPEDVKLTKMKYKPKRVSFERVMKEDIYQEDTSVSSEEEEEGWVVPTHTGIFQKPTSRKKAKTIREKINLSDQLQIMSVDTATISDRVRAKYFEIMQRRVLESVINE